MILAVNHLSLYIGVNRRYAETGRLPGDSRRFRFGFAMAFWYGISFYYVAQTGTRLESSGKVESKTNGVDMGVSNNRAP